MAIFVHVEHLNTKAQLNVNWQAGETPAPTASVITTQSPIPPAPVAPMPLQQGRDFSPVAIILATCALVTAVGKAIYLNRT